MLTTEQIQQRASSYACCSVNALYEYVQAKIYGDHKCAEDKWRMFMYLRWAQTKMCDPCLTDKEKTSIADAADCFCTPCGCPERPEVSCEITPTYTAGSVVEEMPEDPEDGVYLVTDTSEVVTVVGGVETPQALVLGDTVLVGGIFYSMTDIGVGPLFPALNMTLVAAVSVYEVTSSFIGSVDGRTVHLQGLGANGWYDLWIGTESVTPQIVNLANLVFTEIRAKYVLGNGCEYISPVGTIVPPPETCGTVTTTVDVVENCLSQQFMLVVDVESVEGYPLQFLQAFIDGVMVSSQPVSVGVLAIGPYSTADSVELRITNAQDSECDVVYGPFGVTVDCDCPPTYEAGLLIDCDYVALGALVVVASDLSGVYQVDGTELNGEWMYFWLEDPDYAIAWNGSQWGMYRVSTTTFLFLSTGGAAAPTLANWEASAPYLVTVAQANVEQITAAGGDISQVLEYIPEPSVGTAYLAGSCVNGDWTPNTLQTWNGTAWVETTLATGNTILVGGTTLYYYNGTALMELRPTIDLFYNFEWLTFISQDPQIHPILNRTIRLEVEQNGEWVTIYEDVEGVLASGTYVVPNPWGADSSITGVRATYIVGPCEYPEDGTKSTSAACLTAAYEVDFACDVSEAIACRAADRVFVISDTTGIGPTVGVFVGTIRENNSIVATPANGEPVYATVTDDWWVRTTSGVGSLFPLLTIRHVEDSSAIFFNSQYPFIHSTFLRDYVLEGDTGNGVWTPIAQGNEIELVNTLVVTMDAAYRGFRLRYQYEPGCDSATIYEEIMLDIPIMISFAKDPGAVQSWTAYRSYNLGEWQPILTFPSNPTGATSQMTRSHPLNSDRLVYAGNQAVAGILVSSDRGRTWDVPSGDWTGAWDPAVSFIRRGWTSTSYAEDGSIWLAGPRRITRSVDGTAFNDVTFPPDIPGTDLNHICAISADIAVVGGEGIDRLFYTEDAGATWQSCVNVSGREWVMVGNFQYPSIIHLGGGRVLAFSNSLGGSQVPTGPSWVLISNDYGRTFVDFTITPVSVTTQQALQTYGWNDGATVLGRNFRVSRDAGETWMPVQSCGAPPGGFAAFLINSKYYTGIGKFQSQLYNPDGNGFTLNGGYNFDLNVNVFPVDPVQGVPALAPGSFGWPLLPKPRYEGIAPQQQMFMFDINGDASAGTFSAIDTSTGYWTLFADTPNEPTFQVIQVGNDPSDMSALSGVYRIYSSDQFGNPAGVITDIFVFEVPILPINLMALPNLTNFIWQVSPMTVAPSLTGSPLLDSYDIDSNGATVPPDLSGNPALIGFNANDNNLTTGPDFSFTPLIQIIAMQGNNFTEAYVNAMLIAVDAHNTNGVAIEIQGGTAAAPTGAGITAKNNIISRGGSVDDNS